MSIKVGLIGKNISYSRSPDIFRAIGDTIGRSVHCTVLDIGKDQLEETIRSLRASQLVGCSVTIPYKNEIIPFLDSLDQSAARLQSVNSIQISNATLIGHNTDQIGFHFLLASAKIPEGSRALVLGAGGASRAVIASLIDAGMQVTICCRKDSQFAETVNLFQNTKAKLTYLPWSDKVVCEQFHVVVNTTPLGGANQIDAACPLQFAGASGSYFDLNYNAGNRWLKSASESRWRSCDGSQMLVTQAIRSFEIWTGLKADNRTIYQKVFGGS